MGGARNDYKVLYHNLGSEIGKGIGKTAKRRNGAMAQRYNGIEFLSICLLHLCTIEPLHL